MVIHIMEIGIKIKNMVMEFIFKKMEIIIKENGKMIILMDKEFLFGIMVIHIEGNGRIIKDMVMVLLIKIMENLTKEIFFMIKKKVKEEKTKGAWEK